MGNSSGGSAHLLGWFCLCVEAKPGQAVAARLRARAEHGLADQHRRRIRAATRC